MEKMGEPGRITDPTDRQTEDPGTFSGLQQRALTASENPYVEADYTETKILDCIRCLGAQDEEATIDRLSRCNAFDAKTVQQTTEKLAAAGFIQEKFASIASPTFSDKKRKIYTSTERAASFLEPKRLQNCETLERERAAMIENAPPEIQSFLGHLACQQANVEEGLQFAVVEPAGCANQQAMAQEFLTTTFESFEAMGLLRRDNPDDDTAPKQYTASERGKAFIGAYRSLFPLRQDYQAPPAAELNNPDVSQSQRQLEERVASCVGCIAAQQHRYDMPSGANAVMVQKCTGLYKETIQKVFDRLVAKEQLTTSDTTDSHLYLPSQQAPIQRAAKCEYVLQKPFTAHSLSIFISGDSKVIRRADIPLLSVVEEVRLSQIIQTTEDPNEKHAAIQEFFVRNIRLVPYFTRRYKPPVSSMHMEFDDIFQIGLLTLHKSVVHFRADYGVKFSTFYSRVFMRELDREMGKQYGIGEIAATNLRKVNRHIARLVSQGLVNFTEDELIAYIYEQPEEKRRITGSIEDAVQSYFTQLTRLKSMSMQQSIVHDTDLTLENTIEAPQTHDTELSLDIQELFNSLTFDEADRKVVDGLLANKPVAAKDLGLTARELKIRHDRIITTLSHPAFGFLPTIHDMFSWQEQANCKNDSHFARAIVNDLKGRNVRSVLPICDGCPVKEACSNLYTTLSPRPKIGVWGGKTFKKIP